MDTERRSDVLYTDKMNKDFYKQKISEAIEQSFIESEGITKETLVHPNNPGLKAKRVLSLLPCTELLGQTMFDIHLGNKLEKANEQKIFNQEGLIAKVGYNEFQEKTMKIFQDNSKLKMSSDDSGSSEKKPDFHSKEILERTGEYGVLRKKMGEDDEQRMLMMVVNKEDSAEIKEIDYSFFLRNIKKIQENEKLAVEEDMEEETRFKKEEQAELKENESFLLNRLMELYPPTEGILWDKPHPEAKKHSIPKKIREKPKEKAMKILETKIEEEQREDSVDSLFSNDSN